MADETTPQPPVPTDAEAAPPAARPRRRAGYGLVTLALMGMHLLVRFGGMIQKIVLGHFFGTSNMGDVAAAVEKVFQSVYYIGEELLKGTFLPVFNSIRQGDDDGGADEQAAWGLASSVAGILTFILVIITILGMTFTEGFCALILGRPEAADANYAANLEQFHLTVRIVRLSFAGLFCTSLGSLTYGLLNAYKRFVSPALGDLAQKAGIITGIVIMSVGFGSENPIGYALGFILGGVFKLLTHLIALGSKLRMARPKIDWKSPRLKELGLLMLPLLAGSLVGKVRDFAEFRIAWEATQQVVGTAASLDFARKTVNLPINVLPYAMGIALFPFLTDWALRGEKDKVTSAFLSASRNMIFIFAPITALFLLMGPEIITVVFKQGQFDANSVSLVTAAFYVYGAACAFYALEIIANQVFYAHRDTRTPFFIGLFTSTLHIIIAYVGGLLLGLGNVGIAAGYAISKAIKVVIQWYLLRPRLTGFDWPSLLRLFGAAAVASVGLAATVYAGRLVFGQLGWDLGGRGQAAIFVVGVGGLAFAVFIAIAALLRVPEVDLVLAKVRNKLRRGRK
ncbi:MAG TPA: hypothetical protein DCZ72_05875 [Armatimonadetes bacterium]|nr:hypothetical protein [Armatimonadota bacterium]